MKFHKNLSSCSRVLRGRTDRRDDLIVAFGNFANAPETALLMKKSCDRWHGNIPSYSVVF